MIGVCTQAIVVFGVLWLTLTVSGADTCMGEVGTLGTQGQGMGQTARGLRDLLKVSGGGEWGWGTGLETQVQLSDMRGLLSGSWRVRPPRVGMWCGVVLLSQSLSTDCGPTLCRVL